MPTSCRFLAFPLMRTGFSGSRVQRPTWRDPRSHVGTCGLTLGAGAGSLEATAPARWPLCARLQAGILTLQPATLTLPAARLNAHGARAKRQVTRPKREPGDLRRGSSIPNRQACRAKRQIGCLKHWAGCLKREDAPLKREGGCLKREARRLKAGPGRVTSAPATTWGRGYSRVAPASGQEGGQAAGVVRRTAQGFLGVRWTRPDGRVQRLAECAPRRP
jgi:hypothetical protein